MEERVEKKEQKANVWYIYDMVEAIKKRNELGRPLTEEEMKPFIIGKENHEPYY